MFVLSSTVTDGTVISQLHRQHRATEFRKFLITIDKTVPVDLDIHLVCGNYGSHAIKAWLAKHPRVSHAGDTVSVPSGSWQINLG